LAACAWFESYIYRYALAETGAASRTQMTKDANIVRMVVVIKSTPCILAYRSIVEQVERLIRRGGPVKMLVQEFKRAFSVNAVPTLEELDLRAVGDTELGV